MDQKYKLHGFKFTIVPNEILENPNLTAKAKGIMAYILSKINLEGWIFNANLIAENMAEGVKAIITGIRELEANKYLLREQLRDKYGKLSTCIYHFFATSEEYDSFMKERNEKGENDEE